MPRSPLRPLRHRVEAALLRGLGALARRLTLGQAGALGAVLGRLVFALLGRRERIAEENIRASLGDPVDDVPARVLARRALAQLGSSFVEFLWLRGRGSAEVRAIAPLEGFGFLEERARAGKGLVCVTAHYGSWELFGAVIRAHGLPIRYLLPPQGNAASDAYFDNVRRSVGIEPVKIGFGMRDALRSLRAGDFLAMLPDQDARKVGVHVPFFGRPASTHTGPARLAIRSDCPIVVGFLERTGSGRFRMRLDAVLEPRPGAEEEGEVLRLTRELTAVIEQAVRRRPDHWYWLHRRWKTPPPASAS
jgi:KDO2-lipid IV(A) lauroyltransferase